MFDDTDGRCYVHNFELAEGHCRSCGSEFCAECLVYAFGANKPPYCIGCALAASGVRSNAARQPVLSRREIRRREKARRRAEKEDAVPAPKVGVQDVDWSASPVAAVEEDPFAWADDPSGTTRVPY